MLVYETMHLELLIARAFRPYLSVLYAIPNECPFTDWM